jgi:hypothetical protein
MPRTKAPIAQRELVPVMKVLIDAAMSKQSTAHRDIARSKLRAILDDPDSNWRTSFVLNNLAPRRCRYLASIGYWVPTRWTLTDWKIRPGEDKPEAEE